LPVWQRFCETHKERGIEVVTVAMDAGGPDLARRYAREAGATYPVLVDTEGVLATLYGFRAIPNGWIIDPDGIVRFRQVGGFDIRKPDVAHAIERTLTGASPTSPSEAPQAPRAEGSAAFQTGVRLLRRGKKREALDAWFRAAEADPENLLIRKQIWHVLYPDRFEPEVDFGWQKAQREREGRLGIRGANPIPETLITAQEEGTS
jgi:hypothetical protein